jgi:hypothetical protein
VTGLLIGALAIGIAAPVITAVSYHPFEHVYFNPLAGGPGEAEGRFHLDYWGLSYRQALEYVLGADRDPEVRISVYSRPGVSNAKILPRSDRERIEFIPNPYEATYFLTHERWDRLHYRPEEEFYAIRIDGARIMLVLKNTTADSLVTVLGR